MDKNIASMRTTASKVRHLGSARSGTRHAWRMRVTSFALLPLSVAFVWIVLSLVGKDYATVRATLPSQAWRLSRAQLATIEAEVPALAIALHRLFVRLLASRLDHANANARALAA